MDLYNKILDEETLKSAMESFSNAQALGCIIMDSLSKIDYSSYCTQQREELLYTLEFISLMDTDVEFFDIGPNPPDLILKQGNSIIGLEVTTIVNERMAYQSASVIDLLQRVEKVYTSQYPTHLYNLLVKVKVLNFRKRDKELIVKKIVGEIYNYLEGNDACLEYLSEINIMEQHVKRLRIFPLFDADYEHTVQDREVRISVLIKEMKLSKYQNKYDQNWLLLVLPSFCDFSASYTLPEKYDSQLSTITDSAFDKIFIMGRNRLLYLKNN